MENKFTNSATIRESENEREHSVLSQILDAFQIMVDFIFVVIGMFGIVGQVIYQYIVPPKLKPVKGEIVLITGTGHGMGRELALLYASIGATIVGWDVNEKNNQETIEEINQRGYPKAHAYYCDVSNRENVFEVAKKVQKEVGNVTILINNAGIMPAKRILDQTKEDVENVFKINVFAQIWTMQAFLPSMNENNHGHIVALSSCAGLFGLEYLAPYCGSKFAVRGIMESVKEEFRKENSKIGFTTICPYMVDTGLCKRPTIRFEKAMPLLTPSYAAKSIMTAQRRNEAVVTIPRYLLLLNDFTRMFPMRACLLLKDFVSSGVHPDI